ncbi:MAG: LamG domain-containing protein [Bacteroidales bacterium]|nr:LamG domain-containing protein [Bacteroidales bacterium]
MKKISIFAALIGCAMLVVSCDDKNKNGNGNENEATDPSTIASDALIAYFPFDGNGNDSKGGLTPSNTATTSATFAGGQRGQCYQGSPEATSGLLYPLPETSPLKTLTQFAFSMWVKLAPNTTETTHDPEQMIFQLDGKGDWVWGNLFLLQHRNFPQNDPSERNRDNAEMDCYFWKESAAAWKGQRANGWWLDVTQPQWRHIICTYNAATSEFHGYLNGVEFTSPDTTVYTGVNRWQGPEDDAAAHIPFGNLEFNDAQNLVIGAWAERLKGTAITEDVWAAPMRGLIDEFRIYNRSLTATEAKALYDAELSQAEK